MTWWSKRSGQLECVMGFGTASRRPGQIIILFAFGFVAMVACVALAVDVGLLMTTRRSYQKIADTCAAVGAQSASPVDRGTSCTATNNMTSGVIVNAPPATGPNQGNIEFVELTINRNVPTVFMRAFGIQTVPIGVRAVAHSRRALDFGVMGLLPGVDAVRAAGGSSSQINGNACSAGNFKVSGTLNVNGYAVANGSFEGSPNSYGTESGARSAPCEDPGYPLPTPLPVAAPASGGGSPVVVTCPVGSATVDAPAAPRIRINCPTGTVRVAPPRQEVDIQGSNNATVELMPTGSPSNATFEQVTAQGQGNLLLAPGWYDRVSVTSQAVNVQMKPGLYLINSSYDQSGGGTLTGSGVSIIVGLQFEATGTGDVTLSCCAPEMQNNVLIYHYGRQLPGAPWSPASVPNAVDLMGNNSNRTLTGNVYSPLNAPCDSPCVQIGGNSGTMTISGQVAAPTVEVNGTGSTVTFTGNGDSLYRRPRLVE